MSKVRKPKPIGPPESGGERDGKKRVRKLSKSPCGRPPAMPTGVRVLFHVREAKTELEYTTVVHWAEVDVDSYGFETRISKYYVQLRPTDEDGSPIRWNEEPGAWEQWQQAPGAPPEQARQLIHKRTVDKPKDGDPDDWAHVSFGATVRPKTWYYQARVRAEDTEGCKSEWSAWSDPSNAMDVGATRPSPPIPTAVTLSFDVVERERWDRYIAVVEMDEVGEWDIPGGDNQDDVAFYACQLQGGQDVDGPWDGKIRTLVRPARDGDSDTTTSFAFTSKIRKHRYYRARARTIDRFNRRGNWSEWTDGGSPSDTVDPPNPIGTVAYGRHNHVGIDWDEPEHPDDDELPHPDIAYAQVQRSSSASFATADIINFDKYVVGSKREWETTHYRRRNWLRVRFVDGSGNKGDWVSAGPVRPQKVGGQRVIVAGATTREAEIDYGDVIAGVSNRAYRPGAGLAIATINGEDNDGELNMRLQTARTAGSVSVGAVMRYTDASNYLILRLRENASSVDGIQLIARVSGSETTRINTTGSFAVSAQQVYDLRCTISTAGVVNVFLDGVQRASYTLTGGELSALSGNRHGIYIGTDDAGSSRVEEISFTPTGQTVPSFDDGFTRPSSASSLGVSDSGQTWRADSGTLGISPDSVPDGVNADLWATGDSLQFDNIIVPNVGHRKVGETGATAGGVEIEIDRPTRFVVTGSSHVQNTEAADFNVLFFLVAVDVSNGNEYLGRAGRNHAAANDASNNRMRPLHTQHDRFIDCNPGQRKTVRWWWGYRCGGGSNRTCHIGPQAMTIQWHEAFDVVDGVGLSRPSHAKSAITIARYRRVTNSE